MLRQAQSPNQRNDPANSRQANEKQCDRDTGTLVAVSVHGYQVRRPVDENQKEKEQQRHEICTCNCRVSCHIRFSFRLNVRNRPRRPVVVRMMDTVGEWSMRTASTFGVVVERSNKVAPPARLWGCARCGSCPQGTATLFFL